MSCTRPVEAHGWCAYHLHITFVQKLKHRLRQSYGSTAKAANYFQDLLGEMVTFREFCELLRFLRIPFREDEAKSFFAEVGKSKTSAPATSYQMSALKEFLETASPPESADPAPRSKVYPQSLSNPRYIHTNEASLGVDSADFLSPSTAFIPTSPLADDDSIAEKYKNALYFLRDSVEHFFGQGIEAISRKDFAEALDAFFPQKLNLEEVKDLFAQAEGDDGRVTKESFRKFWIKAKEMSGIKGSSFAGVLFQKLRTIYDSWLTAFEDITQGGKTVLNIGLLEKLAGSFEIEMKTYESQALFTPSQPISLQDFKMLWLNELRDVDLKYCQSKTCPEPVLFAGGLCPRHKTFVENQGSFVWTLVKNSLQPKKLVEMIAELNHAREMKGLTPERLRSVLMRFIPDVSVLPRDLAVLSDYLRLRLIKRKEKRSRPGSSPYISPPQLGLEYRKSVFSPKVPWTPMTAGFPRVSNSRKGLQSAEARSRCFQFPYPQRQRSEVI